MEDYKKEVFPGFFGIDIWIWIIILFFIFNSSGGFPFFGLGNKH